MLVQLPRDHLSTEVVVSCCTELLLVNCAGLTENVVGPAIDSLGYQVTEIPSNGTARFGIKEVVSDSVVNR